MAKHTFFVAGTDTDVGKTLVSTGLICAANRKSLKTIGLKPISAGCQLTEQGLRNDDALQLQKIASVELSYEQVNPIAFEPAIAPHLAAAQQGRQLSAQNIAAFLRGALMKPADFVIIEGAGGWRVPLNGRESLATVAKQLRTPVILVVGMKLGCLNHTLLTIEAIVRDGLQLAGWVANRIDPEMACYQENLNALKGMIHAPMIGELPFMTEVSAGNAADHLDLNLMTSY